MSSFVLKIIALITMTIDHYSIIILGEWSGILRVIGRIAFPLFAFQLINGYIHTRNKYKHFMLLLIFGLISQIPFHIAFNVPLRTNTLNIFFTLLLGFMALYLYDICKKHLSDCKINFFKKHTSIISTIVMIPFVFLGYFFNVDYGYWGVLVICIFYLLKDCKNVLILPFIYFILCCIKYKDIFSTNATTLTYASLIATFLPIVFICLYNGKQGKKIKYLFYFYYPLHILIFYSLANVRSLTFYLKLRFFLLNIQPFSHFIGNFIFTL